MTSARRATTPTPAPIPALAPVESPSDSSEVGWLTAAVDVVGGEVGWTDTEVKPVVVEPVAEVDEREADVESTDGS